MKLFRNIHESKFPAGCVRKKNESFSQFVVILISEIKTITHLKPHRESQSSVYIYRITCFFSEKVEKSTKC